ncbi:MAG: toxin-antitoxin system HicB family antitoxin [Acidobacteriaceae bacterium]
MKFCKAEGKTPDTPFNGSFNVLLGHDLHKRLPYTPRSTTENSMLLFTTRLRNT